MCAVCPPIHVFRITLDPDPASPTLRLDGRLDSRGADELLRLVDDLDAPNGLQLDLAGLVFADDAGIDGLCACLRRGAVVHRASPYVRLRLRECDR